MWTQYQGGVTTATARGGTNYEQRRTAAGVTAYPNGDEGQANWPNPPLGGDLPGLSGSPRESAIEEAGAVRSIQIEQSASYAINSRMRSANCSNSTSQSIVTRWPPLSTALFFSLSCSLRAWWTARTNFCLSNNIAITP